jgi:hypothetical protein
LHRHRLRLAPDGHGRIEREDVRLSVRLEAQGLASGHTFGILVLEREISGSRTQRERVGARPEER